MPDFKGDPLATPGMPGLPVCSLTILIAIATFAAGIAARERRLAYPALPPADVAKAPRHLPPATTLAVRLAHRLTEVACYESVDGGIVV